jgi:uncharacterized membrane protein YhaH (DUF805 family)
MKRTKLLILFFRELFQILGKLDRDFWLIIVLLFMVLFVLMVVTVAVILGESVNDLRLFN